MTLSFTALFCMDLIVAVPTMAYYYYWGIFVPTKKKFNKKQIMSHIKLAYAFNAFTILYLPVMLLAYLYTNLLYQFQEIFTHTSIIMLVIILVFEYVNYYSLVEYETKRVI